MIANYIIIFVKGNNNDANSPNDTLNCCVVNYRKVHNFHSDKMQIDQRFKKIKHLHVLQNIFQKICGLILNFKPIRKFHGLKVKEFYKLLGEVNLFPNSSKPSYT